MISRLRAETEFAMRDRVRDYAVLLAVSAALTLPNLGQTSLWLAQSRTALQVVQRSRVMRPPT